MTTSLKSFIRSVRASKTIADERSIIRRESALIRTSFKDTSLSHTTRRINIQKLLYLYILGEKTHFGQIECIKLLASPNFIDKRLGYLATMLLLDENQEVLTLLTNSLNNDLNHPNNFIVALALTTLGNIASPELARDLYVDVEKIISSNNNYLKKKAAIVASKIVEKDPDLSEVFSVKIDSLLDSHDHGVLLGALKLIRNLYENSPESRPVLLVKIPKIIDLLKGLLAKNFNPEFDLMGVHDPFFQTSIIETLRLFFTDEENYPTTSKYNEILNDILTKVASSTDFSRNAGACVSYEAVKTIFSIKNLDPALKVLGINILGQLLGTKDNNNRYVALDTLLAVVRIEPLAVQRHRQTIVACLQDLDISIKRRALELSFAILDTSNIRILIKEILNFLDNPVNNEKDLKSYITTNVVNILERKELIPNEKWKFDTLIRLLNSSGNAINSSIGSQILSLIINIPSNDELKVYTANKIFSAAAEEYSQEGLNLINVWLVGEYGDLLLNTSWKKDKIKEETLVDYLLNLANSKNNDSLLISYILTSALKLSSKISSSSLKNKLQTFIKSKTKDIDLNIQIKAVTYSVLFSEPEKIKQGLLDRVPPPPIKEKDTISLTNRHGAKLPIHKSAESSNSKHTKTEDLLLDLIDEPITATDSKTNVNSLDLLEDIFSASSTTAPSKPEGNNDILGLFDTTTPASNATSLASSNRTAVPTSKVIDAFQNDKVKISFRPKDVGSGIAVIETIIDNLATSEISNLQLLIAVPKTQKLTMSSISNSVIEPSSKVTQDMRINGSPNQKIKLRVKFEYDLDGVRHIEQFDFGKFVETL